jgi:tetratricopeptide (TPR) repeat protein
MVTAVTKGVPVRPARPTVVYSILAALTLASAAQAQDAPAPLEAPRLHAFSDTRIIPTLASTVAALNATRSRVCRSEPAPGPDLDLAAALTAARGLLQADGLSALAASPEGKDPAAALASAGAAVASSNPAAALAALLAAHEAAPQEPAPLVNAAAILNAFGYHAEALALANGAGALDAGPEPVSDPATRAAAANNRGHALLALGRFTEAEEALRQARALQPALAEASTNLAGALLCQGRTDEAAAALNSGRVRDFIGAAMVELCSTPESCDPAQVRRRRAAASALPTAAGREFPLPAVTYPATWTDGNAIQPAFAKIGEAVRVARQANDTRLQKVRDEINARTTGTSAPPAITRGRFQDILDLIDTAGEEPGIAELSRASEAASAALREFQTTELQRVAALPEGSGACQLARGPRRQALDGAYQRWTVLLQEHDSAARAYWTALSKHATGLAANLRDPLHREFALATVEAREIAAFANLIEPTDAWLREAARLTGCPEDAPGASEPAVSFTAPDAAVCPLLDTTLNYAVPVAPYLTLNVACENVQASRATPGWFQAFTGTAYQRGRAIDPVQARATFDGELTVLLGPWHEVSAEAGRRYLVRVNGSGELTDIGATAAPTNGGSAEAWRRVLIVSTYRAN